MKLFSFLLQGRELSMAGMFGLGVFCFAGFALAGRQLPMAWVDERNGYAIAGYDPVDYFVKAQAVRPNIGIETVRGGVSWNFRNVGNKAAFLAHPQVYAPRFGGVDPYLLGKHQGVQGNPTLFEIYENRLYLFYDGVSLLRWKQGRKAHLERAILAWSKTAARLGLSSAKWVGPVPRESKDGFLYRRPE